MKKIRVLVVIAGFNFGVSGGVASVIYNYSKFISSDKIHMDYLALGYQGFEPYREELEAQGGSLHCLNITEHGWKRFCESVKGIRSFLKDHRYDIVHCNSGSIRQVLMMAFAASASKSKVIVHSHSAMRVSSVRRRVYKIISNLFYIYADQFIACSEMAARSMFPKRIVDSGCWTYLPNAIELARFRYNEEIRNRIRFELGIEDSTMVVGHVGRMNTAKNHKFLIEVFVEYVKRNNDAVLLLVGDGNLRADIEKQAEELKVKDKVICVGQRRDSNDLMQAMDVFVFPSLYEGLGMSLIESQAIGLPTISSNMVPVQETEATELIDYLPLNNAEEWAIKIENVKGKFRRESHIDDIRRAGFDIEGSSLILENVYINEVGGNNSDGR